MIKKTVGILGCSGMLGSIVMDYCSKDETISVVGTIRDKSVASSKYPSVEWRSLDAETATVDEIAAVLKDVDWAINCIGIIKPYIHDDNAKETETALRVNALFPHLLAKAAEKTGTKVIQIATDCVYSGAKGKYTENDPFDALDVYGKTKNLGEVYSPNVFHLRCSIIGPEIKSHLSLMDWFLNQPKDAELNGYTNHEWNGVTTLQYAKLSLGVVKNNIELGHIQHVIPTSTIAKSDLLKSFAKEFGREDIKINPVAADKVIDRTLSTVNEDGNLKLWQAAGYKIPPTVEEMVAEVAKYDFRK